MEDGREAGSKPAGEAKRRAAKPLGSAGRKSAKTTRLQLHVGEETARRFAVHCAFVGRSVSAEVDRVLSRFIAREGKGQGAFGDSSGDVDPDAD
jgi:hypothetical protein